MHGYLAMTRTEFRLFRREPFSVVFVLAFPLMMMMLLAAVFGNNQADAHNIQNGMLVWRGVTPANYYTAASVADIVAALGLMTLPITLTGYRQRGILRRFRASSVSASTRRAERMVRVWLGRHRSRGPRRLRGRSRRPRAVALPPELSEKPQPGSAPARHMAADAAVSVTRLAHAPVRRSLGTR